MKDFKHGELTEQIIRVFYDVYSELGHGFLESVYEKSMLIALRDANISVQYRLPIDVSFRGQLVGTFEGDLLVEDAVLLELKAGRGIDSAHEAQLLNYLRATNVEVGLILNFGQKPDFRRLAYDNARKGQRGSPPSNPPR